MSDLNTYAFKGSYFNTYAVCFKFHSCEKDYVSITIILGGEVFRLTENGVFPGYPKKISSVFFGLPGSLDAAFTWSNDKTYFFKVNTFYMKTTQQYPK